MVNTMPLTLSPQRPGGCCVDVDSVDAVRSEHCVSGIWSRGMRKAQKTSRPSHNLEQDLRCRAPLPAGRKNWCTLPLYILWIRRVLRRLRALWHGPQSGRSCCSRRTRWVSYCYWSKSLVQAWGKNNDDRRSRLGRSPSLRRQSTPGLKDPFRNFELRRAVCSH